MKNMKIREPPDVEAQENHGVYVEIDPTGRYGRVCFYFEFARSTVKFV